MVGMGVASPFPQLSGCGMLIVYLTGKTVASEKHLIACYWAVLLLLRSVAASKIIQEN